MGGQWPLLWRLGDLPRERITASIPTASMHPSPAVGLGSIIQRSTMAARLGSRWETNSSTKASRAPTSGTTERRIPGNLSESGILSRRSDGSRHRLRRRRRRSIFRSVDGGQNMGGIVGTAGPRLWADTGSRARAACACTRSCLTRRSEADLHRHLGCRHFPH